MRPHTLDSGEAVATGWYGSYGGRYVPETIMSALTALDADFRAMQRDPEFHADMHRLLQTYIGRPTPLYDAVRLAQQTGSGPILLKREDLVHTGAHKINNALGQVLLAKRLGKQRIVAETGAGQHGVATATACAMLDLPCTVYMGTEDMRRQAMNVSRMRFLGTDVQPVTTGTMTLKEAISAAFRDWVTHVEQSFYVIGSAIGPAPYPEIVRFFQRVISDEARAQVLDTLSQLPHRVVACVGGGSNAIGSFAAFLEDTEVELIGVEAGGRGPQPGEHSATLTHGVPGILQGTRTYVLQNADGQIVTAHSISAGLDYPGVGPEHAQLKDTGRVRYVAVDDHAALEGFFLLTRTEGILPALEPAHAVAWVAAHPIDGVTVLTLSGRGDKDLDTVLTAGVAYSDAKEMES